ncbi:hypothetical protein D3C73_1199470 [compost metagenome]
MEQLDGLWRTLHEAGMHAVADQYATQRHRAVAGALGEGQQVRGDPETLCGERHADPAEPGDDFIEHQQDAVLVADLAQALQIPGCRQDHTRRSSDGLDEHGGNGGGIVQGDQPFQIVGQLGALTRQPLAEGIA